MIDSSTLTQVASIIAGFGATMLTFRIQREIEMRKLGEASWIPFADWLLIAATVFCLVFAVVPLMLFGTSKPFVTNIARGICAASALMVGGWIFGILSHYRLILSGGRTGPRENPEPAEAIIVLIAFIFAIFAFSAAMFLEVR